MNHQLLFTCEHAGNEVPVEYQWLFSGHQEILTTHQGWDPGAWNIASYLARQLNAPVYGCYISRLLIEANRSIDHEQLFSSFTAQLPPAEKQKLLLQVYHPYREQVCTALATMPKPVVHLSIHSFTPIWIGQERKTDIGILFDPARSLELQFSQQLKENLCIHLPSFHIHFNEPYKGTDDGFTTWLRKKYFNTDYAGIEIEVNQKYASNSTQVEEALLHSIKDTMKKYVNHN
jgi:predicted N-formylglutamate amidohydrolase